MPAEEAEETRAAKIAKQAEAERTDRGHESEEGGGEEEEDKEEMMMEGEEDEDTDMERLLGDEAVRGHMATRRTRQTSWQTGETQPWTPPGPLPLPAALEERDEQRGGLHHGQEEVRVEEEGLDAHEGSDDERRRRRLHGALGE